jgi:hypothetical protein
LDPLTPPWGRERERKREKERERERKREREREREREVSRRVASESSTHMFVDLLPQHRVCEYIGR